MAGAVVQVLLPKPVGETFDYAVPDGMTLSEGDYVRAPFGRKVETGVVWSSNPAQVGALKPVAARIDVPGMNRPLREFIDWVAAYTLQPRGLILKQALTVDSAQEAEPVTHYIYGVIAPGTRLTAARRRVLDLMEDGAPRLKAEIARAASCSPSVVSALVKEGMLVAVDVGDAPPPQPDLSLSGPVLSPAQQAAADVLVQRVRDRRCSVTVLEGVTGSSKTEVFATAIREALRQGRQVLVLMPEIALSVQMLARFVRLFGAEPVQWHSELAQGARRRAWRAVASGTAQLVIGARSALFLPFADLGLIVVDEEHDSAYKQEDGVNYHARDMAVVRAHLHDISVILSSATPSVETVVNVEEGRYGCVSLPDRHAGAALPTVEVVDLLKDKLPRGRWLSARSESAVRETLARGEQALLFLNRRGYAPLTICRGCGFRFACPDCTAWMVEHRSGRHSGELQCHHCGFHEPLPSACPQCGGKETFAACGPGVERLEEEAKALFPEARTLVVASDTLGGWRQVQQSLDDVAAGKFDLIIGTQIIAKGHHFPNLTLVVVVDADLGLEGGDVRAGERSFQLLQQVGGRAGRGELTGCVILQTHCAGNFIFRALAENDRAGFLAHEIAMRERHRWPPFARLASLVVSGRDLAKVESAAKDIRRKSTQVDGVEIFGPAPAPLAKLRGDHRMRLLVRAPRSAKLQALLAAWLGEMHLPKGVALKIIIDPFTFS